jgi:hypothetical protein
VLRELREFGEPRSSGWGIRVRLLLSGEGMSEREESEAVVAADAELPGRLEGICAWGERGRVCGGGERGTGEQRRGETGRRNIIRELISLQDRVLYCHQPSCKLCV